MWMLPFTEGVSTADVGAAKMIDGGVSLQP